MDDITTIVHNFLIFQTTLKIYHWQTKSFARHKATDDLHSSISENIDKFTETIQGSRDKRIKFTNKCNIKLINVTDSDGKKILVEFKRWIENDLTTFIRKDETDLINIRDEILGDINKTLYLFTLD
jgi:DNA-binding ferritin-like protein